MPRVDPLNPPSGGVILGVVDLGDMAANSSYTIKVAEDLLLVLFNAGCSECALPYITDGGNIKVVITLNVPAASCFAQVFGGTFSSGTTPCNEVN